MRTANTSTPSARKTTSRVFHKLRLLRYRSTGIGTTTSVASSTIKPGHVTLVPVQTAASDRLSTRANVGNGNGIPIAVLLTIIAGGVFLRKMQIQEVSSSAKSGAKYELNIVEEPASSPRVYEVSGEGT